MLIGKAMLDRNAILESQTQGIDVRNRIILPDHQVRQLIAELRRLHPTKEQLIGMYDRFMRNNTYNGFELFRFIDSSMPLFTQHQMEEFVDKKIAKLLVDARTAAVNQFQHHGRITFAKELLFTRELVMDLTAGLSAVMERRKEHEKELLKHRIVAVKAWLRAADESAIRDAFLLSDAVNFYAIGSLWNVKAFANRYNVHKGDHPTPVSTWPDRKDAEMERARLRDADRAAFPQQSFINDAKRHALHYEILFNAVELLMRRLPCHTDTCITSSVSTANST